jgi:hypothetical protein
MMTCGVSSNARLRISCSSVELELVPSSELVLRTLVGTYFFLPQLEKTRFEVGMSAASTYRYKLKYTGIESASDAHAAFRFSPKSDSADPSM